MKLLPLLLSLTIILASCGGTVPVQETAPQTTAATSAAAEEAAAIPETAAAEITPEAYKLKAYDESLPALKDTFADYFDTGTAINTGDLKPDSEYLKTVLKHYGVFTTENEMKPESINPADGVYNFSAADKFVAFGIENNVKLRGHTLVWHSQVPGWWFGGSGEGGAATSDELLSRMREYISSVMGRYKGKIYSWDVVNECISDSGAGLRRDAENSKWASIVGDLDGDGNYSDYIEQAFIAAREADPDALLILNDYSLEQDENKLNSFYDLAESMLKKGIPLDGVGIQAHIQIGWPSVQNFEKSIEKLAELKQYNPDLKILITELDVSIFDWQDQSLTKEMTPEFEEQLAYRWSDLFEMFRRQAEKGNLDTVITWGFYDKMSWLNDYPVVGRTNEPLLFDREMNTKPAFWGVVDRNNIQNIT
ncbi:MAG: endo-1,4-beta-xylanase [Ruminococcus sp.]|jgi:endo-1,4-beta-xylanase|nr:endo-1,4-beta-xylanase [Ruminococcus sp.]